jgi:osmoprotectant transport system ATP-binding protein
VSDYKIQLKELSKVYPGMSEPAVKSVSMDIPEGEIVVFVGPSGCGKTTTMKMINRLIEPSSGEIYLSGENVMSADPDDLRRRIGYVIQQIGLFPHQTIRANVATVPKLLGWDKKRTNARVEELLDTMGLEPATFADRYPHQLSGGQRQRVGVARALAVDPDVLLMDEPCSALDPIATARVEDLIQTLKERYTIAIVTHNMQQAARVSDRTAFLLSGDLVELAPTDRLFTSPSDKRTEDYITGKFG